jgi:predicted glycoside hydrolase/deacetylase ChbG (UPF0249 family)
MRATKDIIINGDDFGYAPEIDEGIREAYRFGILTSTSAMGNLLYNSQGPQVLESKIEKPGLAIGCHLNLSFGPPLFPGWMFESFTRPFKGTRKKEEWQGSTWEEFLKTLSPQSIQLEFKAQIRKVQDELGFSDHLDSHHCVASYQPVTTIYEAIALELGLPVRHISPFSESSAGSGEFVPDLGYAGKIRKKGVRTTDRLIMKHFSLRPDPVGAFLKELEGVRDGEVVEFMFHPAIDASQGEWRVRDLKLLTNSRIIQAIEDLKLNLTTYKNSAY